MAYYITFGSGGPLGKRFVEIATDNADVARSTIADYFGTKWAFIYNEEQWKGQVEQWGYKKLWTLRRDDIDGRWNIEEDRLLNVFRETFPLYDRYADAARKLSEEVGGLTIGDSICTWFEKYVEVEIASRQGRSRR